jgi:hypothetical protein
VAMRIKGQPSKYRAVRTTVDGYTFASKAEARRYAELKLLEKAGEIRNLQLQPRFYLWVPGGDMDNALGEYRADFSYTDARNVFTVEDVKGFMTPLARWKIKHCEAQYGITVQIVK